MALGTTKAARIAAISIASLLALSACAGAGDQGQADGAFYEGKDLELVVPFPPGGGVSVTAQLISPFLGDSIAGEPNVIIKNIGGGGTIQGANEYALQRDHDGLSTFFTATSNVLTWMIGGDEVKFDLSAMKPVISFPTGAVVYSSEDSGIRTAEDLRDASEPVTLAAKTPNGSEIFALLAFEVLGVQDNVRPIWGYEGGGDRRLAFQRGEVDMDHGTSISYLGEGGKDMVDKGEAHLLFSHGLLNAEGEFVRDPALPDTPTVYELYKDWYGKEPSGDAWNAYKAARDIAGGFGFAILVHEDAPQEAIDALREGAAKAVTDPEFLKAAPPVVGPYEATKGSDIEALEDRLARTTDDPEVVEAIEWMRQWLDSEFSGA